VLSDMGLPKANNDKEHITSERNKNKSITIINSDIYVSKV